MQNLLSLVHMLAQTAAQKSATLMGVGCLAVFFMILCLDKSSFKKTPKKILLFFTALFIVLFVVLYFFVFK